MNDPLLVRKLTIEDRVTLWAWRRDAIQNKTYHPEQNITYQQHCLWFDRILSAADQVVYIGVVETIRVGCVRFDTYQEHEYALDLYLRPIYCGRGWAGPLIERSIAALRNDRQVKRIVGTFLNVNPSSSKLFEQLGFTLSHDQPRLKCELNF